jgi:hypothetical protein
MRVLPNQTQVLLPKWRIAVPSLTGMMGEKFLANTIRLLLEANTSTTSQQREPWHQESARQIG